MVSLASTGCQPELQVRLAGDDQRLPSPSFVVSETDTSAAPQVNVIRVYDDGQQLVWHIRANGSQTVERFSYGIAPNGFLERVAPVALRSAGTYVVVVSGRGAGQLRFSVDSAGLLTALKP